MQAIRVLRAQSRPASPAPAAPVPFAGSDNVGVTHEDAVAANPRAVNPITRIQNFTAFAKRGVTPPSSPSPAAMPSAITQDGTYLHTLGMKLNEAATKALAMPVVNGNGGGVDVWKGKRPIPAGRGRAFAVLIETELDASQGNVNLRHAILRLLPRSFSVLISNISSQLSQLLSQPSYIPINPHTPLQPVTLHALALAQFCAEILETFTRYKICNATSDLAIIKSNLDAIVTRVTTPLFGQLQTDMNAMLEPVGHASNVTSSPAKEAALKDKALKPHSAIVTLNQNLPVVGKALRRYTFDTCAVTQTSLATFHINTLWQAMVQLSHRAPSVPPVNEYTNAVEKASNVIHKSSFHSLAYALTPPASPLMMKRFSPPSSPPIKTKKLTPPNSPLPDKRVLSVPPLTSSPLVNSLTLGGGSAEESTNVKRKTTDNSLASSGNGTDAKESTTFTPSTSTLSQTAQPSVASPWLSALALDAKALVDVLSSSELPRPVMGSLPREAVDETFERLVAFREWLAGSVSHSRSGGLVKLLDTVPEEVPLLIALPVLLGEAWLAHRSIASSTDSNTSNDFPGMVKILGYESDESYRRTVGCGFRRADECECMFAACVLERLGALGRVGDVSWSGRVMRWLEERLGGDC